MKASLEELDEEIGRGASGGGGGRGTGQGKLNELWALVGAANAVKERGKGGRDGGGADGRGEWAVVDEEGLTQLTQVGFVAPFLQIPFDG